MRLRSALRCLGRADAGGDRNRPRRRPCRAAVQRAAERRDGRQRQTVSGAAVQQPNRPCPFPADPGAPRPYRGDGAARHGCRTRVARRQWDTCQPGATPCAGRCWRSTATSPVAAWVSRSGAAEAWSCWSICSAISRSWCMAARILSESVAVGSVVFWAVIARPLARRSAEFDAPHATSESMRRAPRADSTSCAPPADSRRRAPRANSIYRAPRARPSPTARCAWPVWRRSRC